MKEKEAGFTKPCGSNDVLTMALGTDEHLGRVRGVGSSVKLNAYFNIPRKMRDCVSKDMMRERDILLEETKRMLEEQQKINEANQLAMKKENEATKLGLQQQIEMLMAKIEKQEKTLITADASIMKPTCSIPSEKASKIRTQEGQVNLEQHLEDESNFMDYMKGKKCLLAQGSKANIVASGTVVDINESDQKGHNVHLGVGNVRVAVNVCIQPSAELPFPVKGVLDTIKDVVDSHVAWPLDLISI